MQPIGHFSSPFFPFHSCRFKLWFPFQHVSWWICYIWPFCRHRDLGLIRCISACCSNNLSRRQKMGWRKQRRRGGVRGEWKQIPASSDSLSSSESEPSHHHTITDSTIKHGSFDHNQNWSITIIAAVLKLHHHQHSLTHPAPVPPPKLSLHLHNITYPARVISVRRGQVETIL